MSEVWQRVTGRIVRGHGVASGMAGDPRFPEGTLRMQWPLFRERGLEPGGYHPGTLNLAIAPWGYEVRNPWRTFRNVKWCPVEPAEDFSFIRCRIRPGFMEAPPVEALIYYPHPETKPEHFQPPDVLEILAPWIPGLSAGQSMDLEAPEEEIEFRR